jgi:hypothetical protein
MSDDHKSRLRRFADAIDSPNLPSIVAWLALVLLLSAALAFTGGL